MKEPWSDMLSNLHSWSWLTCATCPRVKLGRQSMQLSLATQWSLWQDARSATEALPAERAICTASDLPRISTFAGEHFESLGSRSQGMRAAKQGRLLVNGLTCEHSARIRHGDEVVLLPAATEALDDEKQLHFASTLVRAGLAAVLEADAMEIVFKPAGRSSRPMLADVCCNLR